MTKANPKASKFFKVALIIGLSVLMVLATTTATFCVVQKASGNEDYFFLFDEDEPEKISFSMTAGEGGIPELVIPTFTEATINVKVKEEGYYTMSAAKNSTTGEYVTIVTSDKDGVTKGYSDVRDEESVLMMFLGEGEHRFKITNRSYNDEMITSFNATANDEFFENLELGNITEFKLGTSNVVKAGESKVFELNNTKDDFTNYICATGDNLTVNILDENFTSCGYDSSDIRSSGMIQQFVQMKERFTDTLFAVIINDSDKDVTVSYLSELELFCSNSPEIKAEEPVTLMSTGESGNADWMYLFTPEETKDYTFTFNADTEAEASLFVRGIKDYEPVAVDYQFTTVDGDVTVENLHMEAGTTYAVIVHAVLCYGNSMELTVQ